MRTQRNISRSIDVHGKELNRLFFLYVFECNEVTKIAKKKLYKDYNKKWLDYTFKHRKHKIIPPSPDGFRLMVKDIKHTNQVQKILGITVTKPNLFQRIILFLNL